MLHQHKCCRRRATAWIAAIAANMVILLLFISPAIAQRDFYEESPINYSKTPVHDRVARLAEQVNAEETQLAYDEENGYLTAVLKALDIPVSSQTLVFSKTSLQRYRISPKRPRAIYFNDDVYVGYCQNGDVLEFAATDAKQGASFYTLRQTQDEKPKFVRDQGQCLICHSSGRTQTVPGYLIRSVYANAGGMPEFGSGTFTTDHTSPLKERWGGWYVTGSHGDMRHMGNATLDRGKEDLDRESHANIESLNELVSTVAYPGDHSDIVALMVLEYQTQMHNAIAWANYETRRAIHQSETMNEALDRPQGFLSETSNRRIDRAADDVLKHLLFCDEFVLTSPIKGSSSFAKDFQDRGVRDSKGRTLRDFDLTKRIFRYPCSYLIYSEAFDGLPVEVRSRVLAKLKTILEGNDDSSKYDHLTAVDRRNILDILNDTKPEFAALHRRN